MKQHRFALLIILLSAPVFLATTRGLGSQFAGINIFLPLVIHNPTGVIATPPPAGVQVLSNHTAYEAEGLLHIVGEVENVKAGPVSLIEVSSRINNASGHLLATAEAFTHLAVLPGGGKSCFDIILVAPTGWASYTLDSPAFVDGGAPLTGLTILNPSGSLDPDDKTYTVSGQLRNDRPQPVQYAVAIATLYGAAGKVVGCSFEYVTGLDLEPGQASPFHIFFDGRDFSDVLDFHLQSDSNPP